MQLGMIGLGRMGGNMAKRIAAAGHEVVGYDHSPESDRTVASLKELVAALKAPRLVWVMGHLPRLRAYGWRQPGGLRERAPDFRGT